LSAMVARARIGQRRNCRRLLQSRCDQNRTIAVRERLVRIRSPPPQSFRCFRVAFFAKRHYRVISSLSRSHSHRPCAARISPPPRGHLRRPHQSILTIALSTAANVRPSPPDAPRHVYYRSPRIIIRAVSPFCAMLSRPPRPQKHLNDPLFFFFNVFLILFLRHRVRACSVIGDSRNHRGVDFRSGAIRKMRKFRVVTFHGPRRAAWAPHG